MFSFSCADFLRGDDCLRRRGRRNHEHDHVRRRLPALLRLLRRGLRRRGRAPTAVKTRQRPTRKKRPSSRNATPASRVSPARAPSSGARPSALSSSPERSREARRFSATVDGLYRGQPPLDRLPRAMRRPDALLRDRTRCDRTNPAARRGDGCALHAGRGPLTVLVTRRCRDQGLALRIERAVKQLTRAEKLALASDPASLLRLVRRVRRARRARNDEL